MIEAALGMLAALIGWWARRRIKKLEDENNEYKELAWDIDRLVCSRCTHEGNARRIE